MAQVSNQNPTVNGTNAWSYTQPNGYNPYHNFNANGPGFGLTGPQPPGALTGPNQGFGSNTGYNPNAPGNPAEAAATGTPQAPGGAVPGGPGAAPGGIGQFAPSSPVGGTTTQFGGIAGTPSNGLYGQTFNGAMGQQQLGQKWSVVNDPNYADYQALGTQAQGAALYGQNVLNSPGAASALSAQQQQAAGPSGAQLAAYGNQGQSIGLLQNAAEGNGPTAADIQGQRSISDAMHAQLTAGASARGGAYQQAAAQQQAGANAANIQAQGASEAAQLRAQEMQSAQGQYAQAAGAQMTAANQGYTAQANALGAVTGAQQSEQGMGLNYYNQLAGLYNQQANQAGQLASTQVSNDFGLSGTQLQTQTQQNIANQQQNTQMAGAGIAAAGMIAAAALSTGGAQAAAKGAREHGASEHDAAAIGTHVGQALGMSRAPAPMVAAARPADASAAHKGAMTAADMHAHMAKHRALLRKAAPLPGPETEPMAAHAYAAGSHLAQLAKMHAAPQHGRMHAANGRP